MTGACVGVYVPPANRRCRKSRGSTALVSATTPVLVRSSVDPDAGWRPCVLPAYHWCAPKVKAKNPCEPSVWASVREILALGGNLGVALGRLGYAECVR